jgi:hypothetical protein
VFASKQVITVCSPGYVERHGPIRDLQHLLHAHTLLIVEDHYHAPRHALRTNSYQLLMQTHPVRPDQGLAFLLRGWRVARCSKQNAAVPNTAIRVRTSMPRVELSTVISYVMG